MWWEVNVKENNTCYITIETDERYSNMKALVFKNVLTWSEQERKIRLFRVTYSRQKKQSTFGLQPKLLGYKRQGLGFKVWVFGVVFHWHKAGGGYFPDWSGQNVKMSQVSRKTTQHELGIVSRGNNKVKTCLKCHKDEEYCLDGGVCEVDYTGGVDTRKLNITGCCSG